MRRHFPRGQSPPTMSLGASEKKLHGTMRHQREMWHRILFFVLGALVMWTAQTFCLDPQQSRENPVKQGSVRAVSSKQSSANVGFSVHPSVEKIYKDIGNADNHKRCARYGWDYKPARGIKPRRIFSGVSLPMIHSIC